LHHEGAALKMRLIQNPPKPSFFFPGAILLLAIFSGILLTHFLKGVGMRYLREHSEDVIDAMAEGLENEMRFSKAVVSTMAASPWAFSALTDQTSENVKNANAALDRFNINSDFSVCYLLDAQGTTVASSNRNAPDSFVGKNYAFRPYFQEALRGESSFYMAAGGTSRERGFYVAQPVKNEQAKVVGVAVAKKNIETAENVLAGYPHAFFINPDGIVFISSSKEMVLKTLWPLEPKRIRVINDTQQFGAVSSEPVFQKPIQDGEPVRFQGESHQSFRKFLGPPGWSIVLLASSESVFYFVFFGWSITLFTIGIALMLILWALRSIKAQEALLASEKKLRNITDVAQDAILMMDPHGNISYWNPSAERVLGYRSDEVIGKHLHRLLAPARFHQALGAAFPKFLKTGEGPLIGKTVEVAALRKDGVEIPIDLSLSAFHREDGWHSMGILRDTTERKRAEESLARLNQQNELILNSAAEGILGLDLEGRHTFVNPVAAKMLGYEVNELLGCLSHSLWHHTKSDGSPYPKEECLIYAAYQDGTVHSSSTEVFWRRDGTSFPVEYTSTPIYESEKLVGAVVVFSDITERKKSEDELRRQAQELEMQSWGLQKANEGIKALYQELEKKNANLAKLDRLKNDFVSIVAHELRSPLAVVHEAAAIILDGLAGPVEAQQKTYLEMVRRTADQLIRITNDLLDLAKIESGKIVLNLETIDFLSLARQTCEGISLRAQKKGITVSEDFPAGKLEISGDFDKLVQVMTNLLSNALKFTEKGGITVEVRDLGEEIRCAVRDTGAGISKENLSRLFNKFEQFGRPSSSSEKGTGLGLVISKSIVEAHGGRIWAESELGQGSSLIFILPKKYKKKQKLGEILIDGKALTPEQLAEALRKQSGQNP